MRMFTFLKYHFLQKKQRHRLIPVAIFCIAYAIYASTAARYPVGYGDSDELIMLGYLGGVAHPPGYPLWTLLLHAATHIPFTSNIAFKANLLTASVAALTVSIYYLACLKLFSLNFKKLDFFHYAAAFVTSVSLGFSYLYWLYANVAEVFALNNLFASVLFYLTFKLAASTNQRPIKINPLWIVFGVVLGLAMAHHQTIILLIPGLLFFLMPQISVLKKNFISLFRQQFFPAALAAVGAFILSYTLVLWYADRADSLPVSWKLTPSFFNLVDFITRQDFSGAMVESGQIKNAYLFLPDLPASWDSLLHYLRISLPNHLGLPLIISWLIGLRYAYKFLPRKLFWGLNTLFLVCGPFLVAYLPIASPDMPSQYVQSRALTERMYILSYLSFNLIALFGIYHVLLFLSNYFTQLWHLSLRSIKFARYASFAFLTLIPAWFVLTNYSQVTLRHADFTQDFIHASLNQLPPNSLFICFSDISCFGSLYAQVINNLRPDVIILPVTPQLRDAYLQKYHPNLHLLPYPDNPFRIGDAIAQAKLQQRSVALAEVSQYYLDFLGLEGDVLYLQPGIYFHQLSCNAPPPPSALPLYELTRRILATNRDPRDSFHYVLRHVLQQTHLINGTIYARAQAKAYAEDELTLANILVPGQPEVAARLAALAAYPGEPRYASDQKCLSSQELIRYAQNCKILGDAGCYHNKTYQAVLAEPTNLSLRLLLAQMFLDLQVPELAKREYQFILHLDPQNEIAQMQLKNLQSVPELK